ncbi:MAG: LysR family transcriptional regulator [Marinobacter sp.]|nr:LysR family transcriptional regulator [Marinobacter sp.]
MRVEHAAWFLVVMESGSLAAAARRLGRSRTTLSTALAAFEDELGVVLFERRGSTLTPLPIAAAIEADCRRLVRLEGQIQARCEQYRSGQESRLRIARDDALPETYWHQIMAELSSRFPLTGVSVYLAPPQELAEFVREQVVDMAFGLQPLARSDSRLAVANLATVPVLPVAAPTHPLAALSSVSEDDLAQYPRVTLAHVKNNRLIPDQVSGPAYLALTQFELIRDAVIGGSGWGQLPEPLIRDALQAGRLQVLQPPAAQEVQAYQVVTPAGELLGPVAAWLSERVRQRLGRL